MCLLPPPTLVGHSTSVAHLVENELPLSSVSPIVEAIDHRLSITATIDDTNHHLHNRNDDDDADDDDENTENLSNRNNMSGSYSNLFRGDKLDDADDTSPLGGGGDVGLHAHVVSAMDSMDGIAVGAGDAIGAVHRENVYSNVPFGGASAADGIIDAAGAVTESTVSDPSLHVYSNIASPTSQTSGADAMSPQKVAATSGQHDYSFGGLSSILVTSDAGVGASGTSGTGLPSMAGSVAAHISSTMMADDLDLDDPVTAGSAFALAPKKGKGAADGERHASMEMKNVIPQVGFEALIE